MIIDTVLGGWLSRPEVAIGSVIGHRAVSDVIMVGQRTNWTGPR